LKHPAALQAGFPLRSDRQRGMLLLMPFKFDELVKSAEPVIPDLIQTRSEAFALIQNYLTGRLPASPAF